MKDGAAHARVLGELVDPQRLCEMVSQVPHATADSTGLAEALPKDRSCGSSEDREQELPEPCVSQDVQRHRIVEYPQQPLQGAKHAYFGFNNWQARAFFDNLAVYELP